MIRLQQTGCSFFSKQVVLSKFLYFSNVLEFPVQIEFYFNQLGYDEF